MKIETSELGMLREQVAVLKASPMYLKARLAEKTIDSAVRCIAELSRRVSQLEERGKNGNG